MVAKVTQAWLKKHVGEPTHSYRSKYSKIYTLTGEWEKNHSENTLEEIYQLLVEFGFSKHKRAIWKEVSDHKEHQQRELNRFMIALKAEFLKINPEFKEYLLLKLDKDADEYEHELNIIHTVIEEMALSSVPLLRHTAEGATKYKIYMVLKDGVSGTFDSLSNVIRVNPTLAYNKWQLIGTLVHEYHHSLCFDNCRAHLYLDEFAAHYKQYLVMFPAMTEAVMIDRIQSKLDSLYPQAVKDWTNPPKDGGRGFKLVSKLSDLGDFAIPDNAAPKPHNKSAHGCG